jgi:predicted transcriptional regulator/predicted nucleotidyltransferase
MDKKEQTETRERFQAAIDSFVSKVKGDINVIAVIVCGSFAYDVVWEKSDVDMTVVVRDQNLKNNSYCITEDDITINVALVTRSNFKRYLENMEGGSWGHSYMSKGNMIYTTDDSLNEFFEDNKKMGNDDMELSVFTMACELVHTYDKCLKWLTVKKDLLYAQYYLLKACEAIARIEVCLTGEPPTREVIQKALTLNPERITPYYTDAMSHHYSKEEIAKAIDGIDKYLEEHLDIIKKPAIQFMADQEIKTVTLITKHFHSYSHFVVGIFDYLAEKGVIEKVSQTIRITPKGKRSLEEIGYLYIP